jgi:hypothetical protein
MKPKLSYFEHIELQHLLDYYERYGDMVKIFLPDGRAFEVKATFAQDRYGSSTIDVDYDLMMDNIFSVSIVKPEYLSAASGIRTTDLTAGTIIEQHEFLDGNYNYSIYTVIDATQLKKNKYVKFLQASVETEMEVVGFYGLVQEPTVDGVSVENLTPKSISYLPVNVATEISEGEAFVFLIPQTFTTTFGIPEFRLGDTIIEFDNTEVIGITLNDKQVEYTRYKLLDLEFGASLDITLDSGG